MDVSSRNRGTANPLSHHFVHCFKGSHKKDQVGIDQEKAQSEKDSYSNSFVKTFTKIILKHVMYGCLDYKIANPMII